MYGILGGLGEDRPRCPPSMSVFEISTIVFDFVGFSGSGHLTYLSDAYEVDVSSHFLIWGTYLEFL